MISDPAALTAELRDPATPSQRLVEIAGSFGEFGPLVAEHPNASVDVLAFLLKHGDDQTRKAAARRRARDVAMMTSQQVAPVATAESLQVAETPTTADGESVTRIDEHETAVVDPVLKRNPLLTPQIEELDETRLSNRGEASQSWKITTANGDEVTVTATDFLIGRKPAPRRDLPNIELVTVPDFTKTVSKTHARMILRETQWKIIDLESTNGVYVDTPRGEQHVVPGAEIAIITSFSLGDLRLTIRANDER